MTHRRRRWPKGSYMRVIPDRLRAFVGPEPDKKMSQRELARRCGLSESAIWQMVAGHQRTAKATTAARIAEVLDVPVEILFDPVIPSSNAGSNKPRRTGRGEAA